MNYLPILVLVFLVIFLAVYYFLTSKKINHLKEERMKSEDEKIKLLSEEKNKLQEILTNLQEGIIITDVEDYITLVNRRALDIIQIAEATTLGKHITQIIPINNQKKLSENIQLGLTSPNGNKLHINLKIFERKENNGNLIGKIYIISDVTKQKEFEEMKLDFTTMSAHELRTPLTAIKGYLYLLTEELGSKIPEEQGSYLKKISTSVDQLSALVETLLNVSRVEGNLLRVDFKPIFIEKVLESVLQNFKDISAEKKVKLTLGEASSSFPHEILGNFHLLSLAISSIVENAIEYNNPGGWVIITSKIYEKYLTITISDNGRGIPASATPYLFTKFYRVSNSLTQMSKGSGLSLYITKAIIDAHKGKIWVNSIEGKGTTFSISLPIAQSKSEV